VAAGRVERTRKAPLGREEEASPGGRAVFSSEDSFRRDNASKGKKKVLGLD